MVWPRCRRQRVATDVLAEKRVEVVEQAGLDVWRCRWSYYGLLRAGGGQEASFGRYFMNTILIIVGRIVITLVVTSCAGYGHASWAWVLPRARVRDAGLVRHRRELNVEVSTFTSIALYRRPARQ
jgi:hypothetical protein